MALLFCDNFENWTSTSENTPGPWVRVVAGTAGNLAAPAGNSNVNHTIAGVFQVSSSATSTGNTMLHYGFSNTATIVSNVRVAFGTTGGAGNRQILTLFDGTTAQVSLTHKTNGKLAIFRGTTTAELAESTDLFPFDSTVFLDIEMKVTIHNTTGVIELRVDGATQIASTGSLNTRVSANNQVNEIGVGVFSAGTSRPFFKQFILMDTTGSLMNDFIGPVDVTSLRPNADGNYTAWTALAGDRWDAVNDAVTDGDTTYVHANTATNKVSFAMTDLPAGVTDVFGVFGQSQLMREQGTTRLTRMFVRAGGTDQAIGSTLAVGPTYAFRNAVATLNPHTAAAWTPAEINALELGMEITT